MSEVENASDEETDIPVPSCSNATQAETGPEEPDGGDGVDGDLDGDWEIDFDINLEPDVLHFTQKRDIKWQRNVLFNTRTFAVDAPPEPESLTELLEPFEYFKKYLPDSLFETMAQETNFYAVSNNAVNFPPTNSDELTTFFGMHILMSNYKFPRIRMYWKQASHFPCMADLMPVNRFFKLRNNLHLGNNLEHDPSKDSDRLWKVRPIYDCVLSQCKALKVEK